MSLTVTTIVRTYNSEKWIRNCLDSVMDSDEVLIVDDCSTDSTVSIVREYPFRLIQNPENIGHIKSANVGIRNSTGQVISFMDSDDMSVLGRVNRIKSTFDVFPFAMWCYGDCVQVYPDFNEHPWKMSHWITEDFSIDKQLNHSFMSFGSVAFRREMIDEVGDFNESLPHCEDWEFFIRLSLSGHIPIRIPFIQYIRTLREDSKEHTDVNMLSQTVSSIRNFYNLGMLNAERYTYNRTQMISRGLPVPPSLLGI